MMGNDRENGKPTADPITMMSAMRKELENLKQKNEKEIADLKAENEIMRRKLDLGHTPTGQEDSRNREHSNSKTLTRMEGENNTHHHTMHTDSNGAVGMSSC